MSFELYVLERHSSFPEGVCYRPRQVDPAADFCLHSRIDFRTDFAFKHRYHFVYLMFSTTELRTKRFYGIYFSCEVKEGRVKAEERFGIASLKITSTCPTDPKKKNRSEKYFVKITEIFFEPGEKLEYEDKAVRKIFRAFFRAPKPRVGASRPHSFMPNTRDSHSLVCGCSFLEGCFIKVNLFYFISH